MTKLLFASRNFANAPNETCENEERRPKVHVISVINSERHFLALICSIGRASRFRFSHFRYKLNTTVMYNGKLKVCRNTN